MSVRKFQYAYRKFQYAYRNLSTRIEIRGDPGDLPGRGESFNTRIEIEGQPGDLPGRSSKFQYAYRKFDIAAKSQSRLVVQNAC